MSDKDEFESFEDEFDFEIDDEDFSENSQPKASPSGKQPTDPANPGAKKSMLPTVIGAALLGYFGYQGFQFLTKPSAEEADAITAEMDNNTGVVDTVPVLEPELALPAPLPNRQDTPRLAEQNQPQTLPPADPAPINNLPSVSAPTLGEPLGTEMGLPRNDEGLPQPKYTLPEKTAPVADIDHLLEKETFEAHIERFNKSQDATQTRMMALEQAMKRLADSMVTLNRGLGRIDQETAAVANVVKGLSDDISELTQMSQANQGPAVPGYSDVKSAVNQNAKEYVAPKFQVYAVIPGRAWLRREDGATITITEGDEIQSYGKVLVIDPQNGAVITSSGVTLR